jgi:hypothetical protein
MSIQVALQFDAETLRPLIAEVVREVLAHLDHDPRTWPMH